MNKWISWSNQLGFLRLGQAITMDLPDRDYKFKKKNQNYLLVFLYLIQ